MKPHHTIKASNPLVLALILAIGALVASGVVAPQEAQACSCAFSPNWGFTVDEAEVSAPSNAEGLIWWGKDAPTEADFKVFKVRGRRATPVPFEVRPQFMGQVLIKPTEGWEPGAVLRFETTRLNNFRRAGSVDKAGKKQTVEVTVSEKRLELSEVNVKLEATPPKNEQVMLAAGVSCSRPADSVATHLDIVLPADQEVFRPFLITQTFIDGKPGWNPRASLCSQLPTGQSWRGVGRDTVFVSCAGRKSGVDAGTNKLSMQIQFLAGGAKAFVTNEVAVDLHCPAP